MSPPNTEARRALTGYIRPVMVPWIKERHVHQAGVHVIKSVYTYIYSEENTKNEKTYGDGHGKKGEQENNRQGRDDV